MAVKRFLILVFVVLFSVSVFAGSQQTSTTPASTIITYARWYLNETAEDFWEDDELLVWINQGTMDIAARTRSLESSESVTLLVNTIEYAIAGDYIDLVTVIYNDVNGKQKGLIRKNPQSIGYMKDVGEPVYWYEWAGTVGIYPTLHLITDPGFAIGTTKPSVSSIAFTYTIDGDEYTKAAVAAGTAPGNDVVPEDKYGVVAFDIGSDGTIDAIEAHNNAVGYTTVALAFSDLPQVADEHIRLGYVSAMDSEADFTFGTTDLDAANTTVTYVDSGPTLTVYYVSRPAAVALADDVLVPAIYDRALTLYVASQALLKEGQYGKSGRLMSEYLAELDRYRTDFVERPQEPESNIKMVP